MKDYKYGIAPKTTGVYKITNKYNGKSYIGSSMYVSERISTHMGREARKQQTEFYKDAYKYGYEGFTYELLEECTIDELIDRETYYFNLHKPEYNMKNPKTREFIHPEDWYTENNAKAIRKRKEDYNSPEYKELFRSIHIEKMKPCEMYDKDGNLIDEFISLSEAGRWVSEHTDFKSKNKTSKIKAVCDGERHTAYGFVFRYKTKV